MAGSPTNANFAAVDWKKTTAYCRTPSSNGIYIRVADRPGAFGIPPDEYHEFRERIITDLESLVDDVTGERIVTKIMLREDVFAGDFMHEARVHCESLGMSPDNVRLLLKDQNSGGDTHGEDFTIQAPPPFVRHELVYTPPPGSLPSGFRGFNVVSLVTFTWAVIVSVLTICVGVAFTLRSILRELQTASLKSDFVSFVTHELKTPLTAIRMYAETILDGRVEGEDDRRMCVQIIDQESQRLMHLVDQILEYSKLERWQK